MRLLLLWCRAISCRRPLLVACKHKKVNFVHIMMTTKFPYTLNVRHTKLVQQFSSAQTAFAAVPIAPLFLCAHHPSVHSGNLQQSCSSSSCALSRAFQKRETRWILSMEETYFISGIPNCFQVHTGNGQIGEHSATWYRVQLPPEIQWYVNLNKTRCVYTLLVFLCFSKVFSWSSKMSKMMYSMYSIHKTFVTIISVRI